MFAMFECASAYNCALMKSVTREPLKSIKPLLLKNGNHYCGIHKTDVWLIKTFGTLIYYNMKMSLINIYPPLFCLQAPKFHAKGSQTLAEYLTTTAAIQNAGCTFCQYVSLPLGPTHETQMNLITITAFWPTGFYFLIKIKNMEKNFKFVNVA